MKLVRNLKEIEVNAFYLADMIHSDSEGQSDAALLIRKGRAFYPFFYRGQIAFSPSKFIGYRSNTLETHLKNRSERDGKDTNREINGILGCGYMEDERLHEALERYCGSIGVDLENHKHRFWPTQSAKRFLEDKRSAINDVLDENIGNDSPEYKRRMAGFYERDDNVRRQVLKRAEGQCEYGGCQVFKKRNGEAYLETHHIVSLSEQGRDKPNNVIALCPNHHREAHFGDRWQELQDECLKILQKLGR